jgi:hypothetical protein
MVSPLSLVLANFFMEGFHVKLDQTAHEAL